MYINFILNFIYLFIFFFSRWRLSFCAQCCSVPEKQWQFLSHLRRGFIYLFIYFNFSISACGRFAKV